MLTQVVAERQRPPFLDSARFNDVNVMRMRPRHWSVEERAERIVRMVHVNVFEAYESRRVCLEYESRRV